MSRLVKWCASLGGLVAMLVMISASAAAAPPQQEALTPTITDTPTPAIFFSTLTPTPSLPTATPTATPTLRPPLEGAGIVQVEALVVRAGPEQRWFPLGLLAYNEYVYPVGRDDSLWIAIEWDGGEQNIGWVSSPLVRWDDSVNLDALPLLEWPSVITPLPLDAATPTVLPTMTLKPTVTPTVLASPTSTLPPTSTASAASPEPTPLPPTVTDTPAAVAAVPVTPDNPATEPQSPPTQPQPAFDVNDNAVVLGTIVFLGLGLVAYVGRYLWGLREKSRYADGFVVEECLACQLGSLHLEEIIFQNIGLTRIKRSVRCDVCRSVFRQIRPGTWRYYIDPLVNPQLAEEYNTRQFSDAAIKRLAERIEDYPSELPTPEGDDFPSPEEVIAELEAKYEAAIVNEVADIIDEEEMVLDDANDAIFADLLEEDPTSDDDPEEEA